MSSPKSQYVVNDHSLRVELTDKVFNVTLIDNKTTTEGRDIFEGDVEVKAMYNATHFARKAAEQCRIDIKDWIRANDKRVQDFIGNDGVLRPPTNEIWKGLEFIDPELTKLEGALEFANEMLKAEPTNEVYKKLVSDVTAKLEAYTS